jgi:drug/metabolite transporter (DMT)-like permease
VNARRSFLTPTDALLLLMVVIWAANYTIVKITLREIPPLGFNSLRLGLASLLFLASLAVRREPLGGAARGTEPIHARAGWRPFESARALSGRDWAAIAAFGVIGHFIYQLCFLGGLARTTVSNSSLILGASPVAVTVLSAAAGHERVRGHHWTAVLLSLGGIYLLAGHGAALSGSTLAGDALCMCAVGCWSVYTVASRPMLTRLSPMVLTGYSMAIGTALYVPFGVADLRRLEWSAVSLASWLALVFSAVFALYVAYLVWYTSVQRVGNIRTSVFSNLLPVLSMAIAAIWLGERITLTEISGATAILGGVALTRFGRPQDAAAPPEE